MSLLGPNLQTFLAVAKHKTILAASSELKITQTGVTQRIRTLEKMLSATLFLRSRKGMLLTHEGEALLRYCDAAKDLENTALDQIQKAGIKSSIRIRIAGPTSILRSRVVPQCRKVLECYHNVLFTFQLNDSPFLINDLKAGIIQLAILPIEQVPKEVDSKILKTEEWLLIGPPTWKSRSTIDIIKNEHPMDFDEFDPMTFLYLKKNDLMKYVSKERHFVNNTELLAEMIQTGMGYSVLTHEFAENYLRKKQLIVLNHGKAFLHKVALAWYPRPEMSVYFKAIVDAIH